MGFFNIARQVTQLGRGIGQQLLQALNLLGLGLDALPPLSEQRMVVQERVQLQCMTMLDAWRRERPPAIPPDLADSQLSDERRAELEVARTDEVMTAQRRAFGFGLAVAPSSAGS